MTLQHLGLTTYKQKVSDNQWLNNTQSFIAELKVNQADDLLNEESKNILFGQGRRQK